MAEFCYFCKKKIGLFGKLSSEKVENQFVCGDCVDKVKRIATLYNRNFLEYSLKDMETLIENFELFERHLKSFEKIEAEDTRYCLIKTSAGSMTKFTIVRKRQSRRLLIQHQNRPRVLNHILRSRKVNKQVLRQLIRPLKIKKRHQVEKDVQRLVADVWLYLL